MLTSRYHEALRELRTQATPVQELAARARAAMERRKARGLGPTPLHPVVNDPAPGPRDYRRARKIVQDAGGTGAAPAPAKSTPARPSRAQLMDPDWHNERREELERLQRLPAKSSERP